MILQLKTKRDRNGNSREAFAVFADGGRLLGVWRGYYNGTDAIPEEHRGDHEIHHINVAPAEFRRWVGRGDGR